MTTLNGFVCVLNFYKGSEEVNNDKNSSCPRNASNSTVIAHKMSETISVVFFLLVLRQKELSYFS